MSNYWDKRAAREMYDAMKKPEQIAKELMKLYIRATNNIAKKLDDVFDRYVTTTGLTEDEAKELLEKIDSYDMAEVLKELKKNPKNRELVQKFEAAAYKHRLDVLAQTYTDISTMLADIARTADTSIESMLEDISDRAYYHTLFEIQKRTGRGFRFRMVTPEKITDILGRNWTGANYSSRIWQNTAELADNVKYSITKKLLTGGTLHEVTQEIQEKMASGSYEARRVARTEANYAAGQLQLAAYNEAGIEKYRYIAILDLRTSKVCRSLDNKVFNVKDAKVGVNYHPMHPFCRSTTVAYIPDDWLKDMTRDALDPKTGKRIKIPANMNYEDWYNKYVKGQGLTEEAAKQAEKEREGGRNLTLEQYNRYKARLGDDFPLTYKEFIQMKEDPEEWKAWQSVFAASKNSDEYNDLTAIYQHNLKTNKGNVTDADHYTAPDGTRYDVDGVNVIQRHTEQERILATECSKALGERIEMTPEVVGHFKGVKTPDFVTETGERWEEKAIRCKSKDPLRNEMNQKKAENYMFDISRREAEQEAVIEFAEQVFSASNTKYVKRLILYENKEIIKALSRK